MNGRLPRWSPTGKFVAYEVGTGASRLTRIVDVASGMEVMAELTGSLAVFSPDGSKLAWVSGTGALKLVGSAGRWGAQATDFGRQFASGRATRPQYLIADLWRWRAVAACQGRRENLQWGIAHGFRKRKYCGIHHLTERTEHAVHASVTIPREPRRFLKPLVC
jgi:hypothetical protein